MEENIFKKINSWLTTRDKIIISILLVVLVIVFVIVQKSILLSSIIGKANRYEEEPNAYQEINNDITDSVKTYKIYKKGDKVKTVTITRRNSKVTQYSTSTIVKTYVDDGNSKTVSTYENVTAGEDNITVNYLGTTTVWDIINDAIVSSIKTEKVDGVECYVITGTEDKQSLAEQGIKSVKLYIEKDSGLPVKKVYQMETGEEKVTTYNYEFGVVTDQDMKEPGVTQYRVKTNS